MVSHWSDVLRKMLVRFLKFSSVGVIATTMQYLILIAVTESGLAGPVVASTLGYAIGGIVSYTLNYYYTFASNKRHAETMSKFLLVALIGLFFNGLIMSYCTHSLQLNYLISQVIATSLVLLWNFTANQVWSFNEHENNTEDAIGK